MITRLIAGLIAACWAGGPLAAPPSPPPLSAYGALPALEEIEIAPTGDRVAYVAVVGDERRLVVQPLTGGRAAQIRAGKAKVRWLQWAGPDHLLITTSTTASLPSVRGRHEWFQVISYNVRTGTAAVLLNRTERTINAIAGDPVVGSHRGRPTVFVPGLTLRGAGVYDLYRVDLDTGLGRIHQEGGENTRDWVVRPDGAAVARSEYNDKTGRWRILFKDGAAWREAMAVSALLDRPSLVGLGRDGRSVLVSLRASEERRLFEVAGPGGARTGPLDPADKEAAPLFDPLSGRLLALSYLDQVREYQFFDPALARSWRKARLAFPKDQVRLQSWTPDFQKLVVMVEGAKDASTYYLVDLKTNRADLLGDGRPGVPPEAIAPVRSITYGARDGLPIQAYLTLPVGRAPRGLPLIVLPHGGPQARDEPGFNWWSQALASRGYAVLQPNFRGSEGFGRKFIEAGYGEWGRKMQTDLSDGVRHLAGQGTIDPRRVCIMGASYGGYAALAGATLDPGVYRCAVSVNGVSNLAAMLAAEARDARRANTASVRYWSRFMGADFRQRRELDAVSPARQAARASAPILLIHGKDDTVVPYAQTAEMERALRAAGKPVEVVTLSGEDHWLSRGDTRLLMLRSAVAFVERHNPPR